MKNILIINAHQYYEGVSEGKLSASMVQLAKELFEQKGYFVQITHVEKGYNVTQEVDKHAWADIIITQSPIFWFSSPWIHKKYIDEIFNEGLAQKKLILTDGRTTKNGSKQYGTGGLMQGKKFLLSTSWNAPKESFNDKNQILYEGMSVDEALINISTPYRFCGCEILEAFSFFDVIKNPQIDRDKAEYIKYLDRL